MTRILGVFLIWLFSLTSGFAQEVAPKLEVQFEETQTVPGQPLTLRLTILVPTFMPEPPLWPDLEAANVMVRLPEKATSPTSKQVGGETWSGVTRRYQVTPIVPGTFELPAGNVRVRYRALEGSDTLEALLPVPSVVVTGIVPEGAEGLDPFVAAQKLTLRQTIEGELDSLSPGDSFTRIVEAQIDGASPMFLPSLLSEPPIEGLRGYPESPEIEEKDNRGLLTGIRREKTVYLVEGGVDATLPEVTLSWFNLKTGKVEVATVEAVSVTAKAPKETTVGTGPDRSLLIWWAIRIFFAVAVVASYMRWLAPWVKKGRQYIRSQWENSATFAYGQVKRAVRERDLRATKMACSTWDARIGWRDPDVELAISQAFLDVGAARFSKQPTSSENDGWRRLQALFHSKRQKTRYRQRSTSPDLPALNPRSPLND